ncbi:MAG: hypothetical protein AAGA37_09715 [Actinomycetota bacterium]
MDNLKTTQIMALIGGAVLFLATFLPWFDTPLGSTNAWETEFFGLKGLFVAVIGLAIAGGIGAQAFGGVTLPERIVGLEHPQIHLTLGFGAFLITFGQQFASNPGVGVLLGWIASAVIVASSMMDMRAAPASPPTQF